MSWFTLITYQVIFIIGWFAGIWTIMWYVEYRPHRFYNKFLSVHLKNTKEEDE